MLLARGLRIAAFTLLALHLVSSLAAIGLLGRMRPALERIIERNVASLAATEQMLTVLAAQAGAPATDEVAMRFHESLLVAQSNITEEREPHVVAAIEAESEAALAGDAQAIRRVTEALAELGNINRRAIESADREAQRIGSAGAWTVALLSFVMVAASLVALRQLDHRLLEPLTELHDVLVSLREGRLLRRCRPPPRGSAELSAAMHAFNQLADELASRPALAESTAGDGPSDDEHEATLRALLDVLPAPALLLDPQGELLAANRAGLERLAGDDGASLRSRLSQAQAEDAAPDLRVIAVAETERRLILLGEPAPDDGSDAGPSEATPR